MKNMHKFIISIIIPFIASGIGSLSTSSSVSTWYITLVKPSFNPPSRVFGPVWTILYLLMGISLFLIWIKKKDILAFSIFGIQIFLNVLWSLLFFGLKKPGLAFIEIIILWLAIVSNIVIFYRIEKKSAYLLIPYFLWVSFAAVLNYAIYVLN